MKLRIGPKKSHRLFDARYYLEQLDNQDKTIANPWRHYCRFGFRKGYDPHPLFLTRIYQHRYLAGDEDQNPLAHYLSNKEHSTDPHPLFSSRSYVEQLGGELNDQTALEHFLDNNHENRFSPSVFFNTQRYLSTYAEVAPSGLNALYHYACFGRDQGRQVFLDLSLLPGVLAQLESNDYDFLIDHPQHDVRFLAAVLAARTDKPTVILASQDANHPYSRMLKKLSKAFADKELNIIHVFGTSPDEAEEYSVFGPSVCLQWNAITENSDLTERNQNIQEILKQIGSVGAIHVDSPGTNMTSWLRQIKVPMHGLIPSLDELSAGGEIGWVSDYNSINLPISTGSASKSLMEQGRVAVHQLVSDFQSLNESAEEARQPTQSLKSQLGLGPSEILMVGAGGFDLESGFDRFVSIARQWKSNHHSVLTKFLWVGELNRKTAEATWLLGDLESSGVDQDVLISDDPNLLHDALSSADILISSHRQLRDHDGLFEYLEHDKPIVWFSGNTESEKVMSNDPCGVRPGDYAQAVEILNDLVTNPELAAQVRTANRERLEQIRSIDEVATALCHAMAISVIDEPRSTSNVVEDQTVHVPKLIRKTGKPRVIFAVPQWQISGVNTFIELLVEELNKRDFEAFVLFTTNEAIRGDKSLLPAVPYRTLCQQRAVNPKRRKELLLNFLSMMAPCVFVPNYDYIASTATPELPDNVATLGVLHSDDPQHYVHGYRMGPYWDAIVSVSQTIHENLIQLNPAFESRSSVIRYGIRVPDSVSRDRRKSSGAAPHKMRVIYTGRIVEHQKRIFDFVNVAKHLNRHRDRFELLFVGDGPDLNEFRNEMEPYERSGLAKFHGRAKPNEIPELLASSDVFALTSEFEGLPLSLLEGMAAGLVPVVTDVESGIGEILYHQVNSLISPIGQPDALADNLINLAESPQEFDRLSAAARSTLCEQRLTSSDMADQYAEIIDRLYESARTAGEGRTEKLIYCPRIERLLNVA